MRWLDTPCCGHLQDVVGIASSRLDEYRTYKKKIYSKIRKILQPRWDPIELYQRVWIAGDARATGSNKRTMAGAPDGEYEHFEDTLFWMICARFSRAAIAKMLAFWADEWIGEPVNRQRNLDTAERLLAIPIRRAGWESQQRPSPSGRGSKSASVARPRSPSPRSSGA